MTKTQVHNIVYGEYTIDFSLEFRERKTLAIEVHPDGVVNVLAPLDTPLEKIESRVCKRAGWILRQQREFENYPAPLPDREYVSGESWRYLGRQYRLKLISAPRNEIYMWAGRINLYLKDTSDKESACKLYHF